MKRFEEQMGRALRISIVDCSCQDHQGVPGARVANFLVWCSRDRRAYTMCDICASHSVNNRGMILVGVHDGL